MTKRPRLVSRTLRSCSFLGCCAALAGPALALQGREAPAHVGAVALPSPAAAALPSARLAPGFPRDLWFELGELDVERLLAEDALAPAERPLRIGVPIPVGIELAEQDAGWIAVDGGQLWIATFHAPGAQGLRLELADLDLPRGAELWVRDEDTATRQGPIGRRGPFGDGHLWTQDFAGDTLVVEYWLPAGAARDGTFRIPSAQYLYRGLAFLGGDGSGTDGSCHEDVLCYPAWHPLHQATVRITFVDGGTFLCSATLLATEASDQTPYLLTANHCISSNAVAATLSASFFFQTTSCDGSDATSPGASNSTLLATTTAADISLVMLNGKLPTGMTWAGWSTASFSTGTDLVGIHHPGGQRKKISFGDRVTYPFGGSGSTFFWGVDWTLGTIQGGSSGSALYRASNQLLVGVASHSAEPLGCANPDGPSGYGKFSWFYDNVSGVPGLLSVGGDDPSEPNDTCATARVLADGLFAARVVKSTDEDWYSLALSNCERLTIDLDHASSWGDVDVQLFAACSGTLLASNTGLADAKSLVYDNETGGPQQVLLRVFLGDDTRNEYDLSIARVIVPNCSSEPFPSFCNGSDNAIFWCPCDNAGSPDAGCDNSGATGGVRSDVTAFDGSSAVIQCSGFPPAGAPTAILIRSPAKVVGLPQVFGDGLRCISTTNLVRLAATTAAGGVSVHPIGHAAGPGTFYYQAWYRNTGAFCTPAEFNLSSGREITWP